MIECNKTFGQQFVHREEWEVYFIHNILGDYACFSFISLGLQ